MLLQSVGSWFVTTRFAGCVVTDCVLIYPAWVTPSCVSLRGLARWPKTAALHLCPSVCEVRRREPEPESGRQGQRYCPSLSSSAYKQRWTARGEQGSPQDHMPPAEQPGQDRAAAARQPGSVHQRVQGAGHGREPPAPIRRPRLPPCLPRPVSGSSDGAAPGDPRIQDEPADSAGRGTTGHRGAARPAARAPSRKPVLALRAPAEQQPSRQITPAEERPGCRRHRPARRTCRPFGRTRRPAALAPARPPGAASRCSCPTSPAWLTWDSGYLCRGLRSARRPGYR